jgi:hypothetical protein
MTDTQEKVQVAEADKGLFKEFLTVFPSDSRSLYFLQGHDFGGSFNLDSLQEIDVFVNEWDCAEKKFLDHNLEEMRSNLWEKCNEFACLLASKSYPTAVGLQSVVPDSVRDDWDWPDWVNKDVSDVNAMATEVVILHQEFIASARRWLKC